MIIKESVDTQIDGSKDLTLSAIMVPPMTSAVVNVHVDLKTVHEYHIYDVQPSQTDTDEYCNMVLIPPIYIVEKAWDTEVLYILIKPAGEDTHLKKCETLGFLIETDIELDNIATMTRDDAHCHDVVHYTEKYMKKTAIILKVKISLLPE